MDVVQEANSLTEGLYSVTGLCRISNQFQIALLQAHLIRLNGQIAATHDALVSRRNISSASALTFDDFNVQAFATVQGDTQAIWLQRSSTAWFFCWSESPIGRTYTVLVDRGRGLRGDIPGAIHDLGTRLASLYEGEEVLFRLHVPFDPSDHALRHEAIALSQAPLGHAAYVSFLVALDALMREVSAPH